MQKRRACTRVEIPADLFDPERELDSSRRVACEISNSSKERPVVFFVRHKKICRHVIQMDGIIFWKLGTKVKEMEWRASKIESLEPSNEPSWLLYERACACNYRAGIIDRSRSPLNLNAAGSGAKNNTLERFLALLDACFSSLKRPCAVLSTPVGYHNKIKPRHKGYLLLGFSVYAKTTIDKLKLREEEKRERRVSSF